MPKLNFSLKTFYPTGRHRILISIYLSSISSFAFALYFIIIPTETNYITSTNRILKYFELLPRKNRVKRKWEMVWVLTFSFVLKLIESKNLINWLGVDQKENTINTSFETHSFSIKPPFYHNKRGRTEREFGPKGIEQFEVLWDLLFYWTKEF